MRIGPIEGCHGCAPEALARPAIGANMVLDVAEGRSARVICITDVISKATDSYVSILFEDGSEVLMADGLMSLIRSTSAVLRLVDGKSVTLTEDDLDAIAMAYGVLRPD